MRQYFPTPYESFGGDISVKVDLSNCPNTSKLPTKSDLASLKTELDKLDIKKWVLVPVEQTNWCSKNDVVKICLWWISC